jgi:hypothetical protein
MNNTININNLKIEKIALLDAILSNKITADIANDNISAGINRLKEIDKALMEAQAK